MTVKKSLTVSIGCLPLLQQLQLTLGVVVDEIRNSFGRLSIFLSVFGSGLRKSERDARLIDVQRSRLAVSIINEN